MGSFASEEFRKFRTARYSPSYLINPIFADFRTLLDKMHNGFESAVVTAIEKSEVHEGLRKPRRLTRTEVRRIRTIVRMILGSTSAANKRRNKFLGRISAILTRDRRKNS